MDRAVAASIVADPLLRASVTSSARIFVFGSLLSTKDSISDVDLLVVYRDEESVSELKEVLSPLEACIALDVTYMSETEERRFDFIKRVQAVPIEEAVANFPR